MKGGLEMKIDKENEREPKHCKNPECSNIIIGRRADAIFCSGKCSYIYHNNNNKDIYQSKLELVNLQAYKHLKQLIAEGFNHMEFEDFESLNIDLKNIEYEFHIETELIFSLYDIIIQIVENNIYFETK